MIMRNYWNLTHSAYNPVQQGANFWITAKDPAGTGVLPSDASAISTWADKSGNALNVVQASGGAQPIFNLNRQNGNPGITFNGTAQFLQAAAYSALVNPVAFTLYVVCKPTGGPTTFRCPIGSRAFPASLFQGYWIYANSSNQWNFISGQLDGNSDSMNPGVTSTTNTPRILIMRCVSGSKNFTVASTTATSTNTFQKNFAQPLRIGAGANEGAANFFWNGDIYEIMLFPIIRTDVQVRNDTNYLKSNWGNI